MHCAPGCFPQTSLIEWVSTRALAGALCCKRLPPQLQLSVLVAVLPGDFDPFSDFHDSSIMLGLVTVVLG